MLFAIRLTWHDWCATEIKPFSSRLAFRPRAHSRAKCRQSNNLGWFWFLLDGRSAFRQPQPMYFPYNCVLGHPKAISDLTSGEAFVPKGDQHTYAFWCPFFTHFCYYSPRGRCSQIQPACANVSSLLKLTRAD